MEWNGMSIITTNPVGIFNRVTFKLHLACKKKTSEQAKIPSYLLQHLSQRLSMYACELGLAK
jgi:hypothetical protein